MIDSKVKLIVILGTTASGKTALAIDLARHIGGEIVCADSRTIYRGMNIGTAKPTAAEQAAVPHHLLDVVEPGQTFGAAEYKRLAEAAITDIAARGKVPILVGGSGLYLDSVMYDYDFPPEADAATRAGYEALTDEELRRRLHEADPEAYSRVDLANRRRVVRALETVGRKSGRRTTVRPNTLVLGLALNKEIIQERVSARIQKMLGEGFIHEVGVIGERYGWDSPAFGVIGYRAFRDVVHGGESVEAGTQTAFRETMALYKKQLTWFRRNPEIVWLDDTTQAAQLVLDFLK